MRIFFEIVGAFTTILGLAVGLSYGVVAGVEYIDAARQAAYDRGRDAFRAGTPLTDNPEDSVVGKQAKWADGWLQAQSEEVWELRARVRSLDAHLRGLNEQYRNAETLPEWRP